MTAVIHLCTATLSKPATGNSAVAMFLGSTIVYVVVCLLGYVGLWERLRRRPAPVVEGDHFVAGEWARLAHELPTARIDLAYPAASIDPLQVFDHHDGDSRKP